MLVARGRQRDDVLSHCDETRFGEHDLVLRLTRGAVESGDETAERVLGGLLGGVEQHGGSRGSEEGSRRGLAQRYQWGLRSAGKTKTPLRAQRGRARIGRGQNVGWIALRRRYPPSVPRFERFKTFRNTLAAPTVMAMTEPDPRPLPDQLVSAIFDVQSFRAQLRADLAMLHARFTTGSLRNDDAPSEMNWLLDALETEIGRSVLDLELQGWSVALIAEARDAADRADQILNTRWAVIVAEGDDRITITSSVYDRYSDVPDSIAALRSRADACATTAFRVGQLEWLVPDGTEFWPADFQSGNRLFVRGPAYRHPDGGFGLEPPASGD